MNDKLKIITFGIAVICIVPLIINQKQNEENHKIENSIHEEEKVFYESSYNFSQKKICLDHEFVQYKIKFHENTTIKYKYFLRFRVKDLHPCYYFTIFTDGKKGVMNREIEGKFYDAPIVGYSMVPTGLLMDLNLGRFHISLGKLLFKVLPIGNIDSIRGEVEVNAGTQWFLTMGVYHKSIEEEFFIYIESEEPCIEIIELDRDSKIEYLSAVHGDFSGRYFGLKILSHGFSFTKKLKTEISISKGSIIRFSSAGHILGQIKVIGPNGKIFTKDSRGIAAFQYYGNQTGTWKFSSYGIGFGWKHLVSLFYIDANPYIQINDWDK